MPCGAMTYTCKLVQEKKMYLKPHLVVMSSLSLPACPPGPVVVMVKIFYKWSVYKI